MSEDFNLKYTNGFANYSKNIEEKSLNIDGECKISNYDPRETDGKKKGHITINFSEEAQTIENGTGNGLKSTEKADFSKKKFSIFEKVAALDGDASELSVNDIRKMNKSLMQEWGLKDLKFDFKNGVATLVWGENDILRIDFQTWQENLWGQNDVSKSVATSKKENKVADINSVVATSKTQKTQSNISAKNSDNPQIAKIISNFNNGRIDIKDVKDINSVAAYTGMSVEYITDVLVGLEGRRSWPLCKAEYDGVGAKGHPNGYLTIGFGHTNLIGEPKVTEGLVISEKQAFQILANDIISAEKTAKNKLGNLYDKAPASIQHAIVDLVFNKGPKSINKSLEANLEKGYYAATARRTWYETSNVGLQKRNMYRFIAALEDLNQTQKTSAIKRFGNEHIEQLKAVFKKDIDAKLAWNNMCKSEKCDEYKF